MLGCGSTYRRKRRERRGVVLVLTLIFVVVLVSLALSLGNDTFTNLQKADNSVNILKARTAAESGLDFLSYHIERCEFEDMSTVENIPTSLQAGLPEWLSVYTTDGDVVIPSQTFDDNSFSAYIDVIDDETVELMVTGMSGDTGRSVSIYFRIEGGSATPLRSIFSHGLMARSPVLISGASNVIKGSFDSGQGDVMVSLSSSPGWRAALALSGSASISGDAYASGDYGTIELGWSTGVGGTTIIDWQTDPREEHCHPNCEEPDFPQLDAAAVQRLIDVAATEYQEPARPWEVNYLDNVYIPANFNGTITGKTVFRGVLYIESPNEITFNDAIQVQGIIVTDPTATGASSKLKFGGVTKAFGTQDLPADSKFDAARAAQGAFVILPGFHVHFGNSNVTDANGSIYCGRITVDGAAKVSIKGGVVAASEDMDLNQIGGSGYVAIDAEGDVEQWIGVQMPSGGGGKKKLKKMLGTYKEHGSNRNRHSNNGNNGNHGEGNNGNHGEGNNGNGNGNQ